MRHGLILLCAIALLGSLAPGRQAGPDRPLSFLHILNTPSIHDFSPSPDGHRLAVAASGLGREKVLVMFEGDEPGVPVVQADKTRRDRERDPDWSPDGKTLAFVSDRGGGWHVYVGEPETPQPRQITRHQGEDRRPRWSPGGKRIAYLSKRLGGDTGWDIWVVSAEGGTPHRLTNHPMDEEDPRWSPDGTRIAYTYRGGHHVDRRIGIVAASPATDAPAPQPLLPDEWMGDSHSPRWSPDGKRLAFVSDHDGKHAIYAVSAEGGTPSRLVDSPYEETEPAWSPDGTELAHITNREGNLRLSLTSVSTGRTRPLTLGSGVHSRPEWSPDGKSIVCFYEGPVYPKNVWRFQKAGGRERLTETIPQDLDVRQFIRPELVRYESFDDRKISGFLYMPPDASAEHPASLILRPHDGPTAQWLNGWHPLVQLLAQKGFAVFAPNVRGSTGFGREFEQLNDKDWGRGDVEDLITGARHLMGRPEIRDDRVGIWGIRYGGFLTLAAIARHPKFFTCAIEVLGMPDLEKLYRETNVRQQSYLERELGPLRGNLELYRELSPIRNVDQIVTPLLSFHSQRDPLVPLSTKLPFLRALKKPGYPLLDLIFKENWALATDRFDLYPSASHSYMEKILEFLQIYL